MKTIKVSNRQNKLIIVDDVDYDKCAKYSWCINRNNNQLRSRINGIVTPLPDFIMGKLSGGLLWDHKDRNALNNQRSNYRQATHQQNCANKPKFRGSSKYKGVSWDNAKNLWH